MCSSDQWQRINGGRASHDVLSSLFSARLFLLPPPYASRRILAYSVHRPPLRPPCTCGTATTDAPSEHERSADTTWVKSQITSGLRLEGGGSVGMGGHARGGGGGGGSGCGDEGEV